ncbi:MAG: biotin-dependent carboxyltransferase family protein [Acidobacteriota bacterium]
MGIQVLEAGLYTTVQDAGRIGQRRWGISRGGALDRLAASLLNLLLGNPPEAAVLEMHFPGPRLYFEQATVLAIGGADFAPALDGQPLANWKRYAAQPGQELVFRQLRRGRWAYLAVAGGLHTPRWLGSASMNPFAGLEGVLGRPLRVGDRLPLALHLSPLTTGIRLAPGVQPAYVTDETRPIRALPGAEFHALDAASQAALFREDLTIGAASNRMATWLEGNCLRLAQPVELVSSAVACGSIQLPPDGRPVVLLADAQTIGGYPRVAHIITADLPDFVQRRPGQPVRFQMTTILEAERAAAALRQRLKGLATAVALIDIANIGPER